MTAPSSTSTAVSGGGLLDTSRSPPPPPCVYLSIPAAVGVEGDHLGPLVHLGDDAGRVLDVGLAAGQERLRAQPPPAAAAGGPADTPVSQE